MIEPTGVSSLPHDAMAASLLRPAFFASAWMRLDQFRLEFLQVRIEVNPPREIARIDHVVDLVGGPAAPARLEHRFENLLPKGVDIGVLDLGIPRQIDDVGRRNPAELDVVVGDGHRGRASGVDHQEEVFRPPARTRRGDQAQPQNGENGQQGDARQGASDRGGCPGGRGLRNVGSSRENPHFPNLFLLRKASVGWVEWSETHHQSFAYSWWVSLRSTHPTTAAIIRFGGAEG